MINIKSYAFAKSLEDLGNEFVCIIAGYNDEMDSFLERKSRDAVPLPRTHHIYRLRR